MLEAVILAGGKGTRLRSVTKGGQKVSVTIGSRTFIELLLEKLEHSGFTRVHLALGYRANDVTMALSNLKSKMEINAVVEKEPLGTGGAIKNAMRHIASGCALVLNGDSYNEVDYAEVFASHNKSGADISVLTKCVPNTARYGEVILGTDGAVLKFYEKRGVEKSGHINLGVYVVSRSIFKITGKSKFSMESFLANNVTKLNIKSVTSSGNFIDIGTPEDYQTFIDQYRH